MLVKHKAEASYFTDGCSLFRLEEYLGEHGILLEDASTERIWWVPQAEIRSLGLRPVAPLQKGV